MNFKTSLVALVSLLAFGGAQAQNLIVNGDFEASSVGAGGFDYAHNTNWGNVGVQANAWTFAENTGTGIINRNWNAWGGGAAASAVAFLQDHDAFGGVPAMLSQQFGSNGSAYDISFDLGQRPGNWNPQDVTVTLDGIAVATALTPVNNGGMTHYSFSLAGITGLDHTLSFTSMFNAGDNTAYIDNVSVVATAFQAAPVPEPATYALMGLGLLGIGLQRRRAAKA